VIAERLASRIRTTDFIARYGGEEFVMILCGTQQEDALRLIEEIRAGISILRFNSRGTPLSVTVSCGFTALLPGDSAAAAFDRADKALYQAKQTGRNRCVNH
jgi:diguanylate cyclase